MRAARPFLDLAVLPLLAGVLLRMRRNTSTVPRIAARASKMLSTSNAGGGGGGGGFEKNAIVTHGTVASIVRKENQPGNKVEPLSSARARRSRGLAIPKILYCKALQYCTYM